MRSGGKDIQRPPLSPVRMAEEEAVGLALRHSVDIADVPAAGHGEALGLDGLDALGNDKVAGKRPLLRVQGVAADLDIHVRGHLGLDDLPGT